MHIQGVYKFNQANFQEIPGGILRKIQDMFASASYAMYLHSLPRYLNKSVICILYNMGP